MHSHGMTLFPLVTSLKISLSGTPYSKINPVYQLPLCRMWRTLNYYVVVEIGMVFVHAILSRRGVIIEAGLTMFLWMGIRIKAVRNVRLSTHSRY